ncbi:GNAT family N-acetyltransferase [Allomuricauda sp. R78024]|uniref:GNAT family N-acetyltransferase n=1 Tax=Allomuricauda sp. R78024 TaxID=3093867 RepID=UPI0037C6BAA4
MNSTTHNMILKNNPFTSELYVKKWMSNFHNSGNARQFSFIDDIKFTKHSVLPLYFNIGMFKSCGMSYTLSEKTQSDFKHRTFLVYDVPEYFEVSTENAPTRLGIKKIPQYSGFLAKLDDFEDIDDYLKKQFPAKKRRKVLYPKKQLEESFSISYEFYFGSISRDSFDLLMNYLYDLIEAKFEKKQNTNSHTKEGIRKWYEDLIFDMINENQASFIVAKNEDTPIAITLNYHSENILFSAVPGTDMAYSKYGIGSIMNMKAIEWALENGYSYFDLSKGSYGYKHRWSTMEYNFEYHVLYDRKSPISVLTTAYIVFYYRLKQYLRKKLRG